MGGTSEDGVKPGTVADVPVSNFKELLAPTGHWTSKRTFDCSRWASTTIGHADGCETQTIATTEAKAEPEQTTESRRTLFVCDPFRRAGSDYSTWYQPPYQTASGRVL